MFFVKWFKAAQSFLKAHPAAIPAWVSTIAVVLGLLYQLFYYTPLDIPIFQLSTITDFVLIGSRSLAMVILAALISILLIVTLVLILYGLVIFLTSLYIQVTAFIVKLVFVNACRIVFFVAYALRSVFIWLKYVPLASCAGALGQSVKLIRKQDAENSVSEWARVLRQNFGIASNSNRGTRRDRLTALDAFFDSIRSALDRIANWLRTVFWPKINEILGKEGVYRSFGVVLVILTISLNIGMATINSMAIENYSFDKSTSSEGIKESGFFEHVKSKMIRLRTFSEVEVRLRDDVSDVMYLLQIGGTSNYLLFWREKCAADGSEEETDGSGEEANGSEGEAILGESLVVPVGTVSRIRSLENLGKLPSQCTDDGATQKETPEPAGDCCASDFNFLSKTYLSFLNSTLVASTLRLRIANEIRLLQPDQDGDAGSRLVGIITFDEDANANEWFANPDYRDCDAAGSPAVCVASERSGYRSPYDHILLEVSNVLRECSGPVKKSKLRVVGYYSSAKSDSFFQRKDARQIMENSTARDDFRNCRARSENLAQAFNKCVASDRAQSVKTMLDRLVGKNNAQIVSMEAERRSDQRPEITFPDRTLPEGIYNRIAGSLNRRVDLILDDTPNCVFAEEGRQASVQQFK